MDKLKLLKGMDEQERSRALEFVINSDARLYISITYCGWILVPVGKFSIDQEKEVNFDEVLQEGTFVDGFIEFVNGKKIATELVSMRGQSGPLVIHWGTMPIFFDSHRRPAWLADFKPIGSDDNLGFLSHVIFKVTFDSLAVKFVHQTAPATRTDPIQVQMMRYLDETKGGGDFRRCIEYLLKDPEIDEGEAGAILYTSFNHKPKKSTRKTMQNRFINYKKEWNRRN